MSDTKPYMTPCEKRRRERQVAICRDFVKSYTDEPSLAPNRHINSLAEKYGLTNMGVKDILKRFGVYRTCGRTPEIIISIDL